MTKLNLVKISKLSPYVGGCKGAESSWVSGCCCLGSVHYFNKLLKLKPSLPYNVQAPLINALTEFLWTQAEHYLMLSDGLCSGLAWLWAELKFELPGRAKLKWAFVKTSLSNSWAVGFVCSPTMHHVTNLGLHQGGWFIFCNFLIRFFAMHSFILVVSNLHENHSEIFALTDVVTLLLEASLVKFQFNQLLLAAFWSQSAGRSPSQFHLHVSIRNPLW